MKQSTPKSITIHDIATELQLAASTVSRALNNHPKISSKTKERVLSTALSMGYNLGPSKILENENPPTFALVLPYIKSGFYQQIFNIAEQYCQRNGLQLLTMTTADSYTNETACFEYLSRVNPSALLFATQNRKEIPALKSLLLGEVAAVAIHDNCYKKLVPTYIMDKEKCLSDAISHLQTSGVKNIDLLIDGQNNPLGTEVKTLFLSHLESNGWHSSENSIIEINDESDFRLYISKLLTGEISTDAIVTTSYMLALKIQSQLLSRGSLIEKKVLLLSLDSHEISSIHRTKITHCKFQFSELQKSIVTTLDQQINGKSANKTTIFSPELTIQISSLKA